MVLLPVAINKILAMGYGHLTESPLRWFTARVFFASAYPAEAAVIYSAGITIVTGFVVVRYAFPLGVKPFAGITLPARGIYGAWVSLAPADSPKTQIIKSAGITVIAGFEVVRYTVPLGIPALTLITHPA